MLAVLEKHMRLLRTYVKNVLEQRDEDYLGEIAGKLRLLLIDSRHNRALLLAVANAYGLTASVVVSGPPVQGRRAGEMQWPSFLDSTAAAIRVESNGELAIVSHRELIRAWAEQAGAPHEDWQVDEAFSRLVSIGVTYGDFQITAHQLVALSTHVIRSAKVVIDQAREIEEARAVDEASE